MPIENYGVLKGHVLRAQTDRHEGTPHVHLLVETPEARFRAAVNVRSAIDHADLLSDVVDDFQHPITDRLELLPEGFTLLPHLPSSGALDYVRGHLVDARRLRVQPREGRQSGLAAMIELWAARAIADEAAMVYVFGSRWGPNPREVDRTFRGQPIRPSDGVHNVHMNQGNVDRPGRRDDSFVHENGPWQDGALFFHFPDEGRWVAVFIAFQSQAWHTDDRSGHPAREGADGLHDRRVRIVAALVNPEGPAPEPETVTLLNTTDRRIELRGWTLVNTEGNRTRLRGAIAPRSTRVVPVDPRAPLGNRGGVILLRDEHGVKVDGVAYTERQARREGLTVPF